MLCSIRKSINSKLEVALNTKSYNALVIRIEIRAIQFNVWLLVFQNGVHPYCTRVSYRQPQVGLPGQLLNIQAIAVAVGLSGLMVMISAFTMIRVSLAAAPDGAPVLLVQALMATAGDRPINVSSWIAMD